MNRVVSLWVVASTVVAGVLLGGGGRVHAADSSSAPAEAAASPAPAEPLVCVTDKAKQELETCPNGPKLAGSSPHGKAPEMSFHSKVEELKRGDKKIEVGTADVQMLAGIRDQRQLAMKQRALALLVTEIQGLEGLYKDTGARSKDRPMLLRRLAEDYVELENAAFREKTEAEVKRDELKKTNASAAGKQQSIATSRKNVMERARKAAINYYSTLVTDYSGQPSNTFA